MGIEKDWLEEEESYGGPEGDLPPWGKQSWSVPIPISSKIFYLNAYTSVDYSVDLRFTENLKQRSHFTIGSVPEGQLGADYEFVPFASIPVRVEEKERAWKFHSYLLSLSKRIGLTFLRLHIEKEFPRGEFLEYSRREMLEIESEGRRFLVRTDLPFSHPRISYANAYNTNRYYGGAEEGGWWYDAGEPIASIPFSAGNKDQARFSWWKNYLTLSAGWSQQFELSSVLGHDIFEVSKEAHFATPYPRSAPRYE